MKHCSVWSRSRLVLPFCAWCRSRSRPSLVGAVAGIAGHRTSIARAARKSGGSATLQAIHSIDALNVEKIQKNNWLYI